MTRRFGNARVFIIQLSVALSLVAQAAVAQSPVSDLHVHLRNGEESLRAYERQVEEGRLEVERIGVMWFGGPNQALAGRPNEIRAGNDGIIALAAEHAHVIPIATLHRMTARRPWRSWSSWRLPASEF